MLGTDPNVSEAQAASGYCGTAEARDRTETERDKCAQSRDWHLHFGLWCLFEWLDLDDPVRDGTGSLRHAVWVPTVSSRKPRPPTGC